MKVPQYTISSLYNNLHNYRRRGKIRWDKRSRFQLHQSFRGNTFTLPWPKVLIIQYNQRETLIFTENFRGTLENREKHKSLAQRIFPRLRYSLNQSAMFPISHLPTNCLSKTTIHI